MSALYRINPLKWDDRNDRSSASVPMGAYWISKDLGNWELRYGFDEYYDEATIACKSMEHAKLVAWEDWLKRITPALELVEEKR